MPIDQKPGEFGSFGDKIAIGELEAAAQGIERLAQTMTEPDVKRGLTIAVEYLRTRKGAIAESLRAESDRNTPGVNSEGKLSSRATK